MTNRTIGIEMARKVLGDLANEVRYTKTTITLTRNGAPIAQLAPIPPDAATDARTAEIEEG
ncbi:hypothetical protein [Streptomyces bacillaris]|uniref:hypothetical protein n=1 Tax=Streptomyces bacillaris TaxID=68179 RepID=UPI00362956FA